VSRHPQTILWESSLQRTKRHYHTRSVFMRDREISQRDTFVTMIPEARG
jgi:hypothetical protein